VWHIELPEGTFEISEAQKAAIEKAQYTGKGISFKGYHYSWYALMKATIYEEQSIDTFIKLLPEKKERPTTTYYRELAKEIIHRSKIGKRAYRMSQVDNARKAVGENPKAIFDFLDAKHGG
jgi:hypothetical protein